MTGEGRGEIQILKEILEQVFIKYDGKILYSL